MLTAAISNSNNERCAQANMPACAPVHARAHPLLCQPQAAGAHTRPCMAGSWQLAATASRGNTPQAAGGTGGGRRAVLAAASRAHAVTKGSKQ